ncbi:hypothetical protein ES703_02966 [subsurface metagenome]
MEELEILARNVKRYREVKGLKQTELATKVGLTSDTLCKIETGKQPNVGSKYLISISRELDVELFQLFMADPEALTIKLIVSDQNLRSAKRLLDEIVKRTGDKKGINIYLLK